MQTRIRETGNYGYLRSASRCATACLVYGGLVLLSSCSLFQKQSTDKTLVESLQGICLTGSGKGRIEFENGRHLFDYESLVRNENKQWALGLNLPIIGQELLELEITESFGEHYKVKGTFARRLNQDIKSKRDRVLLAKFFQRLSEFVWVVSHKDTVKAQSEGWSFYHDGQDLFGEVDISKSIVFKFKAFSFNAEERFYQRVGLSLAKSDSSKGARKAQGFDKDYIQLQLFVGGCSL